MLTDKGLVYFFISQTKCMIIGIKIIFEAGNLIFLVWKKNVMSIYYAHKVGHTFQTTFTLVFLIL